MLKDTLTECMNFKTQASANHQDTEGCNLVYFSLNKNQKITITILQLQDSCFLTGTNVDLIAPSMNLIDQMTNLLVDK